MLKDLGPKYQLGFGIAPSNVPYQDSDATSELSHESGFIAKALHGHPFMRFAAVSIATMAAMHTASSLVEKGGIKLNTFLVDRAEGGGKFLAGRQGRNWATTLLDDFRRLQRHMDEWEGVVRVAEGTPEEMRKTQKIAGFWQTLGAKQHLADLGKTPEEIAQMIPDWELRDTIQQSLVRQARRLPYQLPAAYIVQRGAVDRLTGRSAKEPPPKWYNPVDVLGDFAQQSFKNLSMMLLPVRTDRARPNQTTLGRDVLAHGFNKLMTLGDFASDTYGPSKIKDFSIGMTSALNALGQDVSDILYKTAQFSGKTTGAMATAIAEGVHRDKSFSEKQARVKDVWSQPDRFAALSQFVRDKDQSGLAATIFPKGHGFFQKVGQEFYDQGKENARIEAIRRGDPNYQFIGSLGKRAVREEYKSLRGIDLGGLRNLAAERNLPFSATSSRESLINSLLKSRITHQVGPISELRTSGSDVEHIAEQVVHLVGSGSKSDILSHRYGQTQLNDSYKRLLQANLVRGGVDKDAAQKFVAKIHVNIPHGPDNSLARRISFGEEMNVHDYKQEVYLHELKNRSAAIVGPKHAEAIVKALPTAASNADTVFTDAAYREDLHSRIHQRWERDYKAVIVPFTQSKLQESKLEYRNFGKGIDPQAKELLVRKAAQSMGISMLAPDGSPLSQGAIKEELIRHGFHADDQYQLRAHLVDKGVIAKPWELHGFNLLGLRPLSIKSASQKKFFGSAYDSTVGQLLGDVQEKDPYIGGLTDRRVGKGIWETTHGHIIDLTDFKRRFRRGANMLADDVQIPFLHTRPLNLFFYGAFRKMAEKPILGFESGLAGQEFGGTEARQHQYDAFFWLRQKGSKGQLVGVADKGIHRFAGTYRPSPVDDSSILGRMARYAIGDKGRVPNVPTPTAPPGSKLYAEMGLGPHGFLSTEVETPEGESRTRGFFVGGGRKIPYLRAQVGRRAWSYDREAGFASQVKDKSSFKMLFGLSSEPQEQLSSYGGKVRNWLRVDYDQPQSLIDWYRRGKNRQSDPFNPAVLSGKIEAGMLGDVPKSPFGIAILPEILKFQETQGFKASQEFLDSFGVNEAKGFNRWMNKVRGYGLTTKTARALSAHDSELADILGVEGKPLSEIRSHEEMLAAARTAIAGTEKKIAQIYESARAEGTLNEYGELPQGEQRKVQNLRRAAVPLKSRYLEHAAQGESYFRQSSPQAMRSSGIHNRMDEFRADFYRYLQTTKAVNEGEGTLQRLVSSLDDLHAKNLIGGGEYVEARAAILSMQVNLYGLESWRSTGSTISRYKAIIQRLQANPVSKEALKDIASYDVDTLHEGFGRKQVASAWKRKFGRADYHYSGAEYNPFGAKETVYTPTFGTVWNRGGARHKLRALSSTLGLTTWSDPDAYSQSSTLVSHGFQRLNRHFAWLGGAVDETKFRGPVDLMARGFGLRRIAPAMAIASTALTVDRTLGGLLHHRDRGGHPIYSPLILGGVGSIAAHAEMLGAGVIGGKSGYDRKREQLLHGEVPVRQGRWWLLGSQPWKGGRVQYYQPSWYQRLRSGANYTPQTYGSPLERFAFENDFSPLRPLDPYHWERKHFLDRPYPVSGPYFTGPFGPATTLLNATVGRVLKPPVRMHKQEMQQSMQNYQQVGEYGMAPMQFGPAQTPYATVSPSGALTVSQQTNAASVLRMSGRGPGVLGPTAGGVSTTPNPSGIAASQNLQRINAPYEQAGAQGGPSKTGYNPYNQQIYMPTEGFSPRLIPMDAPMKEGSPRYQAGELGYKTQEMFGIYGFAFGALRTKLGFGSQDFTPKRPVLTSAGKGYGAQRQLANWNIGGLGDIPNPSEGEYGNVEFGELLRRFAPHDRMDINQVNPIPNQLGQRYPWLPSDDYIINLHQGDPYAAIPEGELRLPGPGYERTHQLHPDETGPYGLADQFSILGNTAPWSQEYHGLDRIIDRANLTPEGRSQVDATRYQVAQVNKRHNFTPYLYKNTKFQTREATFKGFIPGEADVIQTSFGPVQFAGVQMRNTQETMAMAQELLKPNEKIKLTYDVNAPPAYGTPPKAMVTAGTINVNRAFLQSPAAIPVTDTSTDVLVNRGSVPQRLLGKETESLAHGNSWVNAKFVPHRTAIEDWERSHVYGTEFPNWTHPVRDYVGPLGYRAANRNPLLAASILAGLGSAFGTNPEAKSALKIIGAGAGLGMATLTDARSMEAGNRFVPMNRLMEMGGDEYSDILNYVKYTHLYNQARSSAIQEEGVDPDQITDQLSRSKARIKVPPITAAALEFKQDIHQTLYGADLLGSMGDIQAAIPARERDHFEAFMQAPLNERPRILSVLPLLQRRVLEARWGMRVEQKPDLTEYFSEHELPPPNWPGYSAAVPSDAIKLKIMQHMGVDAAQAGYYPQQIQEANLINVSYPDYNRKSNPHQVAAQLQAMMARQNIKGRVRVIPSATPGSRVQYSGIAS